jgi:hypothetical protein
VYQDLTTAIQSLFPIENAASNERRRHINEANHYQIGFNGREREMARLERLQKQRSRCVVVAGSSGAGKTALLANWFCRASDENNNGAALAVSSHWLGRLLSPMRTRRSRPRIDLIRFGRLTDASRAAAPLALSIIRELHGRLELKRTLPRDETTALAELAGWLGEAGRCANVRLVVARIDEIEGDPTRVLSWLPNPAPAGVSIVVSVGGDMTQSNYVTRLCEAGWLSLSPGPMTVSESRSAIEDTLRHYGKQVAEPDAIVAGMSSRLPRFTRTLLEAIRVHGEFGEAGEKLQDRIDWYLESSDEIELYERVIRKWSDDFESDHPGFVQRGLSLLLVSHSGLEETELLDLLGDETGPLPRYSWTPLQAFAERELCGSSGRMQIAVGPFQVAVRKLFAIDDQVECELRGEIIDYFRTQPVSVRQMDEMLWQLAALGRSSGLADWITKPDHIHQFWPTHEYVLKRHYQHLRDAKRIDVAGRLRENLETGSASPEITTTVCQLLFDLGEYAFVDQLASDLLKCSNELDGEQHRSVLAMLASVRIDDRPTDALDLLDREEELCRQSGNRRALAACIGNQAIALRKHGKLDEASIRHGREEELCRDIHDLRLLAGSLSNQAQLHILRNEHAQAESKLPELEQLARTLCDVRLIGRCMESRGVCLSVRNKHVAAAQKLREAADCYLEAVDNPALAHCLFRLAETHYRLGDLDAALECLDRGETVAKDLQNSILAAELSRERERLLSQFQVSQRAP